MRLVLAALALAACSQGEATQPSASAPVAPAKPVAPQKPVAPPTRVVETPPADAAVVAEDPARVEVALESADGAADVSGSMSKRRPENDLGKQIEALGSGSSDAGPHGRIVVQDRKALDDTDLDVDRVLAKMMAAYMAGLQRCYKVALARDATAHGSLVLDLTIAENGIVSKADVTGFDDALSACVRSQVTRWRFWPPKQSDGSATEAAFQLTLQLTAR
jgi:hypothetical protein